MPEAAPALYDQIEALYYKENGSLTPSQVVERIVAVRDTRSVPCDSTLATLLKRGADFSNGIDRKSAPAQGVAIDIGFVTVDVLAGQIKTTMTFPATSQHPIGAWARELRLALTAYIAAEFNAR